MFTTHHAAILDGTLSDVDRPANVHELVRGTYVSKFDQWPVGGRLSGQGQRPDGQEDRPCHSRRTSALSRWTWWHN